MIMRRVQNKYCVFHHMIRIYLKWFIFLLNQFMTKCGHMFSYSQNYSQHFYFLPSTIPKLKGWSDTERPLHRFFFELVCMILSSEAWAIILYFSCSDRSFNLFTCPFIIILLIHLSLISFWMPNVYLLPQINLNARTYYNLTLHKHFR